MPPVTLAPHPSSSTQGHRWTSRTHYINGRVGARVYKCEHRNNSEFPYVWNLIYHVSHSYEDLRRPASHWRIPSSTEMRLTQLPSRYSCRRRTRCTGLCHGTALRSYICAPHIECRSTQMCNRLKGPGKSRRRGCQTLQGTRRYQTSG
jgi:hypothetical protein